MSDNLEDSNITFDNPIVVISIGHTCLAQGADTIKLPPDLFSSLKSKGVHMNSNGTVSEFWLFDYVSSKVRQLINMSGKVRCMSANRYGHFSSSEKMPSDTYICGNITTPSGSPRAVRKWNETIGNKNVCAFIELHFDGAGTSRRSFIWCSDYSVNRKLTNGQSIRTNTDCYRLALLLKKGFINSIPGWTPNINISSAPYGKGIASDSNDLKGAKQSRASSLWRNLNGTDIVSCLVELFNGSSTEDCIQTLSNIDKVCEEMASSFVEYATGKGLKLSEEQLNEATYVRSVSTASGVEETYTPDQKKQIALDTQNNLTPIERKMGEGGDKYSTALRNSVEIIGTAPSLTKSYRKDTSGTVISKPFLRTGGIVNKQETISSYESIDRDLPFGNKTISACGNYSITAGELNLISQGNANITTSGIFKMGSNTQLELASADNLIISGQNTIVSGSNILVTGNTSISGNLSVDGGALITGATYIGGGVSAPTFNGPWQIESTNSHELYGYLAQALTLLIESGTIKATITKDGGGQINSGDKISLSLEASSIKINNISDGETGDNPSGTGSAFIKIPAHNHQFKRLAGTLASDLTQIQNSVSGMVNS